MGRPERPITTVGPVAAFAERLRTLRRTAGGPNGQRNYRTMAAVAKTSPASLSLAASGKKLPSWKTTLAYIRACGVTDPQEIQQWLQDWEAVSQAPYGSPGPQSSPAPKVASVPAQREVTHTDVGPPDRPGAPNELVDAVATTKTTHRTTPRTVLLIALGVLLGAACMALIVWWLV